MNSPKRIEPFKECPRFSGCSVNRCPPDPGMSVRPVHPDDKEKQCPMEKPVRLRIAAKYPGVLKLGGLTPMEAAGRAVWEKRSPAEKLSVAEGLKTRGESHRFQKPGKTE